MALFYPVLTYGQIKPYSGAKIENLVTPKYDASKQNVFIVADPKMTEMFDMLAPFYVFNATGRLNVFIVANEATPIPLKKDLYVLPQLTFSQVDAKQLRADVIVIPALSARDENQDPNIIGFIRNHFGANTRILAICDGASTAAATGLYDNQLLTAHATDFDCIKQPFDKPVWVKNVSVTRSGNLYSTAGVSNAVDGSLQVIEDLLGKDARITAARAANYPHDEVQIAHNSQPLSFGNKLSILRKMTLSRKKKLGLLLHDGLNELKFASIVDTYGRTYPKEFRAFSLQGAVVRTQNGLTFLYTGNNAINPKMDELHVIKPESLTETDRKYFSGFELVTQNDAEYPIDQCISRIGAQFGDHYATIVN